MYKRNISLGKNELLMFFSRNKSISKSRRYSHLRSDLCCFRHVTGKKPKSFLWHIFPHGSWGNVGLAMLEECVPVCSKIGPLRGGLMDKIAW